MAADYQHFLEAMIKKYGVYRVILAPYGLVPLLVGFGLLQSRAAGLFVGTWTLFFISFVVIVSLTLRLRTMQETNTHREVIVNRYSDLLLNRTAPFHYREWDEYTEVGKGGDAVVEWYLTLEVTKRVPVHLVWLALYKTANATTTDKQRRRIRVTAMEFEQDGHNKHFIRTYWTTERWQDSKLGVFVHFHRPLHLGETARIYVRWSWPEYYDALAAGGQDVVEWSSMRAHITNLRCDLTFAADCGFRRGLAVSPYPGTSTPRLHVSREGVVRINLEQQDIPIGQKKIGLTLDASRNIAE